MNQEVEHFEDFFVPRLKEKGYEGILSPKLSGNDGLALFYSTAKLSLIKSECFYFKDILKTPCNQTGILGAFELKEDPKKKILLANIHLKAGPEFEELREQEAKATLEKITSFQEYLPDASFVVGDFNAEPHGTAVPLFIQSGFTNGVLSFFPSYFFAFCPFSWTTNPAFFFFCLFLSLSNGFQGFYHLQNQEHRGG